MSSIPAADDVLDPGEAVYDLPAVADLLGVPVTKVHQQLREGHLVAVRRDGAVVVPKVFFDDTGHVVKSLSGLLVVLHDGGYRDTEIVRWLFTPDPSLTIRRDGVDGPAGQCPAGRRAALASGPRGGAPGPGDGVLTAAPASGAW